MTHIGAMTEQAQVTNWPMRIVLTFLILVVISFLFALVIRSWRRRARLQERFGPLPDVPEDVIAAIESGELSGEHFRFVGTSTDVNWLDKVAHQGLSNRGNAQVYLPPQGIAIDREGAGVLFIARESIIGARLDKGVAGRAYTSDGVAVVRWKLNGIIVDSGLRSADGDLRRNLVNGIEDMTRRNHA